MNRLNTARDQAAEAVDDVIAEATGKAKRARAAATRKAQDLRKGATRAKDAVTDDLREVLEERDLIAEVRDFTRRHPGTTLVGAAVAGAALALLLRAARR